MVDEAYYEFSGVTALTEIERVPHLFVCRTFSKVFGMAAMRLGCLFSHPANIQYLHKAQSPYSVNSLAVLAAQAAVADTAYIENYVAEVLAARELLCVGLEKLGIAYVPSSANFVLGHFGKRAIEVRDPLRGQAILVRDRSYEAPGGVRITVGTRDPNPPPAGGAGRNLEPMNEPLIVSTWMASWWTSPKATARPSPKPSSTSPASKSLANRFRTARIRAAGTTTGNSATTSSNRPAKRSPSKPPRTTFSPSSSATARAASSCANNGWRAPACSKPSAVNSSSPSSPAVPRAEAQITLRRFAGSVVFHPIIGMYDVENHKPHPEGLLRILEANPGRKVYYIGDTVDDARCARAAKVPFIGIAAPSNPRYIDLVFLFQEEGAWAIIDDINVLPEVFAA